jgi:hypothetical protein
MKSLFLIGFAMVLFTACEKQEKRYTQQSPEIDTHYPVNNPSSMKQKIVTDLGLLDISIIISDLEELQEKVKYISKNLPLNSSEIKIDTLNYTTNELSSIAFISKNNKR